MASITFGDVATFIAKCNDMGELSLIEAAARDRMRGIPVHRHGPRGGNGKGPHPGKGGKTARPKSAQQAWSEWCKGDGTRKRGVVDALDDPEGWRIYHKAYPADTKDSVRERLANRAEKREKAEADKGAPPLTEQHSSAAAGQKSKGSSASAAGVSSGTSPDGAKGKGAKAPKASAGGVSTRADTHSAGSRVYTLDTSSFIQ